MDQVTRALTPDEIARVEARQNSKVAAIAEVAMKNPPKIVLREGQQAELVVPLEFHCEYDGQVITEVTIRRPLMREWRAYLRACSDAVKNDGPGADDLVDQPWISVPAIVLESLDFTDGTRVEAEQDGFFARSALGPETDETDSSSSTSESGEA